MRYICGLGSRRIRRVARRAWLAPVLFSLLFASDGEARSKPAAGNPIDRYVREEMVREKIPGLALLVMRHGHVTEMHGFGLANVELGVPVSPSTMFQSASVAKQFTAMATLVLAEQGKISLSDPVSRYFPDAPPTWRDMRVENLLSHTAGLDDFSEGMDKRKDYSEDDLVRLIEEMPLKYPPGTGWSYSNPGYVLLGILIHRVTGRPYGEVLREDVFDPLGMPTARTISIIDIIPNRATGYRLDNGRLTHQKWVSPSLSSTADGGLELSLRDFVSWENGLRRRRLVSAQSYARMWSPFLLKDGRPNARGYGFGWVIRQVNGRTLIEHEGRFQGFTTNISRYTDDDLTIVVLTNQGAADPGDMTHHIAGLIDPLLDEPPSE